MIKKGTLIQNNTTLAGIDIGSAKCCCSIGKINYETGKIAGYMTNPRKSTSPDEPKKKVFMGWTEQDLGSRYWNSDPVEAYNKWMIENTETIKVYDSDTDKYIKQKFCRIHIIDLQMPSSSGVVPNQLFVLYRPTPLPPKIRE